ncbi:MULTISPECIES: helix-turn-helix transcriptional regulator [Paenibacillus]|uniref:AraC family transcriptional regulator n=1 Tax=Paenibacillus campinasensis TaxID=66347 RepID=A0A268EYG7_9BACL|nr:MULTISPECIES: helix-turn-helix domain-containing protein [Paenibacillus]MUG65326.1 helix-turn-helix domain-containing protein [Paenibacillus campinasensis]PAD78170.1 AraC family transcriptional regulator [Paenibacillus campinasensis]PAK48471.1 AraC family transcriptional regulator [Paenibacillus sp. 7541]
MTLLNFRVPPLPEYIHSGMTHAPIGAGHPNRINIGIFDLLVVRRGQLDVTENGRPYEIKPGMFLILRPDTHHYGTRGCVVDTDYYWLHFQTSGEWSADESGTLLRKEEITELKAMTPNYFTIKIPLFGTLPQPAKALELLAALSSLAQHGHQPKSLWRQQVVFQELIEQLAAALDTPAASPSSACAEKAAAYLRQHYREDFKAQRLGDSINFHPVYIARCMQKEFGCSPVEYLQRYRIEQAKMLLLQTDMSISRVAEEVGFNHAAYFTSSFAKIEGISPRQYRQRFFMK